MTPQTKRTVRTVLQTIVALAVALPGIVAAAGIPDTLPWVAGALAAAAGTARVMQLPTVERLLDRIGIGIVDDDQDQGAA
ncbi:hypothetical protein ACSMX9_22520 [Streptomyces sp. LE64]|uniref:hypothetical protein n=1 Tax=Streptomyces sp. LE64 TaxID=3448653 RepID=UPI0040433F59